MSDLKRQIMPAHGLNKSVMAIGQVDLPNVCEGLPDASAGNESNWCEQFLINLGLRIEEQGRASHLASRLDLAS